MPALLVIMKLHSQFMTLTSYENLQPLCPIRRIHNRPRNNANYLMANKLNDWWLFIFAYLFIGILALLKAYQVIDLLR